MQANKRHAFTEHESREAKRVPKRTVRSASHQSFVEAKHWYAGCASSTESFQGKRLRFYRRESPSPNQTYKPFDPLRRGDAHVFQKTASTSKRTPRRRPIKLTGPFDHGHRIPLDGSDALESQQGSKSSRQARPRLYHKNRSDAEKVW